jgi:hypothetical protein
MIQDNQLRAEFYRIQEQFATIIFQDVIRKGGMFYTAAMKPSNVEIDKRLLLQGDDMPFLLAGGGCRWISCRNATDPKIRTQGAERVRSWIATKHGGESLETSNAQRTAERDTELYPGSGPSW